MLLQLPLLVLLFCLTPEGVMAQPRDHVGLPQPALTGATSLEQLLALSKGVVVN